MRQVSYYYFNELSKEMQEKMLSDTSHPIWQQINQCLDFRFEVEDLESDLEVLGIDNAEIYFTGFGSPGDGACFTGDVDIVKFIKHHNAGNDFRRVLYHAKQGNVSASLHHSGRYYHTMYSDGGLNVLEDVNGFVWEEDVLRDFDGLENEFIEFLAWLQDMGRDMANEIYKKLSSENDYRYTREYLQDFFEANPQHYEFDENGNIV